jgi:hypothetical protein
MALGSREKRTVMIGGAAVLVIALLKWGIAPLWGSWCDMGDELAPKVQALQRTRERLERRQALLARRARLVKQIGWVSPPDEKPDNGVGKGKDTEAAPALGGSAAKTEERPAAKSEGNSATKAQGDSAAKPPERTGFEAELEKAAGKCKVDLKSLVAEKARPGERLTCFEQEVFRVEAEATPEALVALLHALEKGPRLVRVDELTVRPDTSKPGPAKVTLQIVAYARAAAERSAPK